MFGFGKKDREQREAKLLSDFTRAVWDINQEGAEYKVQAGSGIGLLYVILLDKGFITTIPEFAEQNKIGRIKIIGMAAAAADDWLDKGELGRATGAFMFRMWLVAIDHGYFHSAMDMQKVLGDLLHTWWESPVSGSGVRENAERGPNLVAASKVSREQLNRVWAQADEWLWYRLHPDLKPTSTGSSDSDIFTKPSQKSDPGR